MATANQLLEQAYNESWVLGTPNRENCSGFVKSAGRLMGFDLPDGTADAILAELEALAAVGAGSWERVGVGTAELQAAVVLAGATSREYGQRNGHVALVLPKLVGPHRAPLVYGGGSAGARSAGTRSIREVWSPSRRGVLRFFVHRDARRGDFEQRPGSG
jgi:hypothetical protein